MSHSTTLRLAAIISAATIGLSGCSQLGLSNIFEPSRPGDTPDYATASIPDTIESPKVETGIAAWDGDISSPGRTAAHATMAPGSWARVTNSSTGASAVVQITRRLTSGRGRTIELSRDAAADVGALQTGLATVMIEPIDPRQAAPSERLWVRADQSEIPAAPTVQTQRIAAPVQTAALAQPVRQSSGGGVEYDPNLSTASIPQNGYNYQASLGGQSAVQAASLAQATRYLQIGSYREARNAHLMLERLSREGMATGAYGDAFVETKYIGGAAYHRVRLGPIETDTEAQRALRDAKALGHKDARILRP